MTILDAYETFQFEHDGIERTVFRRGAGPAVIVMHEVPGLHPAVIAFCDKVAEAGFTVWMPSLLGKPGKPWGVLYNISSLARACIAREFTVWATRRNSPITHWLRALARHAHEACGGQGVGAIGMCLTGGFALAMMVDEFLRAPVLSQPSLPFALTRAQKRDVGVDDATLAAVEKRADDGACLMALRFTADPLVPSARFERLREELGENFIAVEIDSTRGNPHGIGRTAHSVLALHLVEEPGHPTIEARDKVLAFLEERLR